MKQQLIGAFVSFTGWLTAGYDHPPSRSPALRGAKVPYETDLKLMRLAVDALPSPCFFNAYGSVIVNASSQDVLCKGHNQQAATGDPTEHGEVDAIRNCVSIFMKRGLTPAEIAETWQYTWLYTTAEPCPMCMTTCLHSGFQRVIYATSGPTLYKNGWREYLVTLRSSTIAAAARAQHGFGNGRPIAEIVGHVGSNETDPLFQWQFQPEKACPQGCMRKEGACEPVS